MFKLIKKYMKRVLSLLCFMLMVSMSLMAKGGKALQYDITGTGSGNEGMVLVKVFVYGKNVTDQDIKQAAVHGVVFRGCSGNNSGVRQPAMASPETENSYADFCNAFFSAKGECQNYASIIDGSYERIKTAKGLKYGAIVQVDKKALRKKMEKVGIVRSLSSGF